MIKYSPILRKGVNIMPRRTFDLRSLALGIAILGITSSVFGGGPIGKKLIVASSRQEQTVQLGTARGRLKAHRLRLLAKLSETTGTAQASATAKQLQAMGERITKRYGKLPQLLVLEQDDAARLRVAATGMSHADQLNTRIKALRSSGLFEFVEPDWVVNVQATPSDAAFADGRLWGLRNTGQSGGLAGADLGAVAAWDVTTGNSSIVVGVIDTGIRYTHQDLAGNMWQNPGETPGNGIDDDGNGVVDDVFGLNAITGSGNPMDDNGHGSHCAGTIGAVANAGGPHVGVAWQVRLMALKFLGSDGSGYTSDAIECIDYAIARGVDILSNSWGGGGYSLALATAIQRALDAGILFVAAAGNESNNNDVIAQYPANYTHNNVISVAALDRSDQLAGFSNYGATTVDLGAPGVDIYSCVANSDSAYAYYSGTSMATPHVAGVAALVAAQYPGIAVAEMRQRLLSAVVPVAALAGRCTTGGRVNAPGSLSVASDGILEVSVSAASNPLAAQEPAAFYVRVSDLSPVLNATVTGGFTGDSPVSFLDNGTAPDVTGGDGVYSATLTAPDITGNADVAVDVSAPGKVSTSVTQNFSVVGRPSNDDFADRITIPAGITSVSGDNRNATVESGEPLYAGGAGNQTVWWTWTAPADGPVTISTTGSDFDTILAVYLGSAVHALLRIAGNDDSDGLQSSVTFSARSGFSYAIQVNGYGSASGDVQLNLSALTGAPRIADEPDDVRVLLGNPFSIQVQADGQAPLMYQWYQDGGPVSGAIASTYSRAAAVLADEGTYHVVVSNALGTVTSRSVFVAVELVDVRPDNDDFAGAEELPGESGRLLASTALATGETGEPDHAGVAAPLASIWYWWTAPATGRLNVNTFESGYDTVLVAYRGATLGTLTVVAGNDDTGGLQSELDFAVSGGVTYRIAVDGYGDAVGDVSLAYEFTEGSTPPALDFDGDGLSDVASYQMGSGLWSILQSGVAPPNDNITQKWGVAGDIPVPGDYDGDGETDIAVFRIYTGVWYVILSKTDEYAHGKWGITADVPVCGDYDGDGFSDLAIFRRDTSTWYIHHSSDGSSTVQKWGVAGDTPVPADYDGDGRTDVGIYRYSTKQWVIQLSGGGTVLRRKWGVGDDIPVPADYDGDKMADIAVFRPSTGHWFVLLTATATPVIQKWGIPGDTPVPADYDGDDVSDFAIRRPSVGKWIIERSSDETALVRLREGGDWEPVLPQYHINQLFGFVP